MQITAQRRSSLRWVFALRRSDGDVPPILLATDADFRIVQADLPARCLLSMDVEHSLTELFAAPPTILKSRSGDDQALCLTRSDGSEERWLELATPPLPANGLRQGAAQISLHSRPRIASLARQS